MFRHAILFTICCSIAALALFPSCKKEKSNENPNSNDSTGTGTDTTVTTTPAALLSTVDYWDNPDTLNAASSHDTIYYNADKQIEKVISLQRGSTIVYLFTYNSAGKVSTLNATKDSAQKTNIIFYYNAAGTRLDSTSANNGITINRLSYDTSGNLHAIYAYGYNGGVKELHDSLIYIRNASQKIDSIAEYHFKGVSGPPPLVTHKFNTGVPATNPLNNFPIAYLLTYELRYSMDWDIALYTGDLYIHQFFNPDDYIFRSGTAFSYNSGSAVSYSNELITNSFDFNTNSQIYSMNTTFNYSDGTYLSSGILHFKYVQ